MDLEKEVRLYIILIFDLKNNKSLKDDLVLEKEGSYKCHGNPSQVCNLIEETLHFLTVLEMRLSK